MADKRMRILQVVPAVSKESGVMRYVWNMTREMKDKDFVFDYLFHIPSDITFEKDLHAAGSHVYQVPDISKSPFSYMKNVAELMSKNASSYAVVHCHVPNTAFYVLRWAEKLGVRNRLLHSHLATSSEHVLHRVRNYPLIAYGKQFATGNLACSSDAGDYLFGKKAYEVFRNGIDTPSFLYDSEASSHIKVELSIDSSAFPVIGCVGRLAKQKNYPLMLRVFKEILVVEPNAVLLIAGSGPDKKVLTEQIHELGIEGRVRLLGLREDINKLYSVFDVFVMPSLCEGLPVAAVEAQTSGLRCVFSEDVSREADITGVSSFLNRKAPLSKWRDSILCAARSGRVPNAEKMVELAGYSRKSAAMKLADYYRSLIWK